MNKNVILAIDQGSSGTRAFAVDAAGAVLYKRTDIMTPNNCWKASYWY